MQIKTKPTSDKQIAANRRNSLKSTGPASPRGRAVSSQNARKYELLPFENPELPAQLTAEYYGRFIPGSKSERRLVDIMVYTERVLRNCSLLETRVGAQELANRQGRTRAQAIEAASQRLIMLPHIRNSAECAHRNALSQLEATRTKAA